MESTQKITATPSAIALSWLTLNGRLGVRTAILTLAFAGVAAGILFSWKWLVAAGLSSLVVGVLPCVAMCAAGMCMRRGGKGNSSAAIDAPASATANDKP